MIKNTPQQVQGALSQAIIKNTSQRLTQIGVIEYLIVMYSNVRNKDFLKISYVFASEIWKN